MSESEPQQADGEEELPDEDAEEEEVEEAAVEEPDEEVAEDVEVEGDPDEGDGGVTPLSGDEREALTAGDDSPDIGGCDACEGVAEGDLLVVYNENFDFPWKSGNPFARVCPECGSQTFTAKAYWQSQEVPYIIPKGEDEPKPLFDCPYEGCGGEFLGTPDECPECERELLWED